MPLTPAIAILDVGKTNKKIFLFDESYNMIWEESSLLAETKDEDGDPCEDLDLLNNWTSEVLIALKKKCEVEIQAINFSAYGASFVHIGKNGKSLTPLYSYLKPFPEKIKKQFYDQYGGELTFSMLTASPVLGSLNSGMQIYRIITERPELYSDIRYSLHLPQYLSWLLTGNACSDITSIGCHTNLWNFSQNYYHEWVYRESVVDKLAPIQSSGTVRSILPQNHGRILDDIKPGCIAGIGLHDSSAAMIPYLESFQEPFILISTGTWCISMNPFNTDPLTAAELQKDCLCYMSFKGQPIKASRLFAGHDHDHQKERLSEYFQKGKSYHNEISFEPLTLSKLQAKNDPVFFNKPAASIGASVFSKRDLSNYACYEEAYHRLMMDIMDQQVISTRLIFTDPVKRIFVDGGFSRNPIYMHLLANAFPLYEVFAAMLAQASAIGAAMAIHEHWNTQQFPTDIIELKYYKKV
jgi:sugar (pentulose or hexulose) kinase